MRTRTAVLPIALMATLVGLGSVAAQPASAAEGGVVLTASNTTDRNRVIVWRRAPDGHLTLVRKVRTGGRGTGDGLGNQGGLSLSANGRWLTVVNAGSDDISQFRLDGTTLRRTDVVRSRGDRPTSVASHGDLVYVLNAGGAGGIQGFRRTADGRLIAIAGSKRPLSGAGVDPAQIGFSRDGGWLIVTEVASDRISRYRVDADGVAHGPFVRTSPGAEPFGFDVTPSGIVIVSEAGDHLAGASSMSSYRVTPGGRLKVISAAVPTQETAACWVAVTPDGRYAYETNTPDGSITGFRIAADGSLSILDANGRTALTGAGSAPIDLDTSADGRFLYVLLAGTDRIAVFAIDADDGSLRPEPGIAAPRSANGLVVR